MQQLNFGAPKSYHSVRDQAIATGCGLGASLGIPDEQRRAFGEMFEGTSFETRAALIGLSQWVAHRHHVSAESREAIAAVAQQVLKHGGDLDAVHAERYISKAADEKFFGVHPAQRQNWSENATWLVERNDGVRIRVAEVDHPSEFACYGAMQQQRALWRQEPGGEPRQIRGGWSFDGHEQHADLPGAILDPSRKIVIAHELGSLTGAPTAHSGRAFIDFPTVDDGGMKLHTANSSSHRLMEATYAAMRLRAEQMGTTLSVDGKFEQRESMLTDYRVERMPRTEAPAIHEAAQPRGRVVILHPRGGTHRVGDVDFGTALDGRNGHRREEVSYG